MCSSIPSKWPASSTVTKASHREHFKKDISLVSRSTVNWLNPSNSVPIVLKFLKRPNEQAMVVLSRGNHQAINQLLILTFIAQFNSPDLLPKCIFISFICWQTNSKDIARHSGGGSQYAQKLWGYLQPITKYDTHALGLIKVWSRDFLSTVVVHNMRNGLATVFQSVRGVRGGDVINILPIQMLVRQIFSANISGRVGG